MMRPASAPMRRRNMVIATSRMMTSVHRALQFFRTGERYLLSSGRLRVWLVAPREVEERAVEVFLARLRLERGWCIHREQLAEAHQRQPVAAFGLVHVV